MNGANGNTTTTIINTFDADLIDAAAVQTSPDYAEFKRRKIAQALNPPDGQNEQLAPKLPDAARIPEASGRGACDWLDQYIDFSRLWSPRGYDHFHEAAGLFILSTIAARRIGTHFGRLRHTSIYAALTAWSSKYAKTTTADIAIDTLYRAGLGYLLAADSATPQKFIADMTAKLPDGYDRMSDEEQERTRLKIALSGKRGWFYEEFGQHMAAMMRDGGFMADFRGLLRRLDDGADRYEYGTIGRGSDVIVRPYLALLANLTPDDLRPFAKRGSTLWGDGFLARFALIAPPADGERSRDRFPDGERVVPGELLQPLQEWHQRLGVPQIDIVDVMDKDGKTTGDKRAECAPPKITVLDLSPEVKECFYTYHDGLLDTLQNASTHDLDANYSRFAEKALRIATLMASISGAQSVDGLHWAKAQAITERWREGLHQLYNQLNEPQPSEALEDEERVLRVIRQKKQPTAREISQTIRLSSAEVKHVLGALVETGAIEKAKSGRTEVYQLAP